MHSKIKHPFTVLSLFVVIIVQILILFPVQKTSAISIPTPNVVNIIKNSSGIAKNNEIMCHPPVTKVSPNYGNGDHYQPTNGWITLRFLTRNTIKVVINVDGKCQSPTTLGIKLDMKYISTRDTPPGNTKRLLEGIVRDNNTTDSTWQYLQYGNGSAKDDSRLDNFTDGTGLQNQTKDALGSYTKIVTPADLKTYLKTTEYFPSFDNALVADSVANCRDNGDGNQNFVYRRYDSKMQWTCEASIQNDWTGLSVGGSYADLNNFNITYVVQVVGNKMQIVPVDLLTYSATGGFQIPSGDSVFSKIYKESTFLYCDALGKFVTNDCTGDLSIDTPSTLLAENSSKTMKLTINNKNGKSMDVMVAGANTESAQSIATIDSPGGSTTESCESNGGAFGFLLCPILRQANNAVTWLDGRIMNQLVVNPSFYQRGTVGGDKLQLVWARLRNIGYILLLIVVLIMVIGTAIGSSSMDAYTVKRTMPRLLIAVIFMALSLDIVRILVDITNAVGIGVGGLIAEPFGGLDALNLANIFHPIVSLGTTALGAGMLAGLAIRKVRAFILGILGSFIGSIALVMLVIFVLLAARDMLLIFLMVLSPIAILFWVFPGNNKVWKMWWDSFYKLLLLFPVIIALLITGRGFALIISMSGNQGITVTLMKIVAFIGPYFFIIPAFKFAGGAFANLAGAVNGKSKGLLKKNQEYRQKRYAKAREGVGGRVIQRRADWHTRLQKQASKEDKSALTKRLAGVASRVVGANDIQAQASARNAAEQKKIAERTGNGRDDALRGLSVDKALADSAEGVEGEDYRTNDDGVKQYHTMGGGWVSEAAVDEGHRRWGHNAFVQQESLSYEIGKAIETGQVERISENFGRVSEEVWGMSAEQAQGAMKGAGFKNQNQSLEFKYMNREVDETGKVSYKVDGKGFTKELYERRGSYGLSQMTGNTINRLEEAYDEADKDAKAGDAKAIEIQARVRSIVETFVQRGLTGAGQQTGVDASGKPVYTPPPPAPTPSAGTAETEETTAREKTYAVVSSPGAGSVNEKVAHLAAKLGLLDADGAPSGAFDEAGPGSDQKGLKP